MTTVLGLVVPILFLLFCELSGYECIEIPTMHTPDGRTRDIDNIPSSERGDFCPNGHCDRKLSEE